jgi:polysaccharide biosynthesis transport protein
MHGFFRSVRAVPLSMDEDQRLTPLPKTGGLREVAGEYTPAAYAPYYDDDSIEGGRSIRQYLDVVYKRLPWIITLTVLVTAAVAFYVYRLPDIYEAQAVMLIEPRRPKVTSKDSININFGNDINYYNTQLRLLQSPELLRDVVIDLGLHKDPILLDRGGRGVGSTLRSIFSSEKPTASPAAVVQPISADEPSDTSGKPQVSEEEKRIAEKYASEMVVGLNVAQQERTNLVNVSVKSYHPDLAAKLATGIARVFKEQDARREVAGAEQAKNDLSRSIEELKGTISGQEAELISFMKDSNLPLQEKGQELSASRLQGLSETWMKAMEERRNLEGRYNAAVAANAKGEGGSLPDLYENKIYQDTVRLNAERRAKLQDDLRSLDKELEDLEARRKANATKWTDEHPAMLELIATINEKRSARQNKQKETTDLIEKEQRKIESNAVSGALTALRSQLDAKRREEAQAQSAYEREASLANVQGVAETRMTTLKRSIDTNRNLLDTYTQRLKEQELAIANSNPDNIKIPSEAVAPTTPTGPQRQRNIMIAFLLSLAAGIGLAFLADYLDDSVKTSDDIGRQLGLPTLALIPHHELTEKRRLSLVARNGGVAAPVTSIVTLEERHSPMAEAYRHLRTSLLFSSAGKPPQTILVTSSQPSEGKTTTAINTAITLAQSDADVVIIDCDLRRPRLHSYFEMDNTEGLTNYLSGEPNTDHLIKRCKSLPRLRVITSGPIPPNPAELLSSEEMRKLLQFLRGRYKHVIIDSPPAISFTDAAILSTLVDGVVLVAMANKSSMHLMRRFKQRLGNIGARIYGVVLNGIKSNSIEYDYYGGYYDYYGKSDLDTATPYIEEAGTTRKTNGAG